jgi:hypothetical protein
MATLYGWLRLAVVWEWAMYRSLFRWLTRRYDVPAGATSYSYVGVVNVLLWAFIGGSTVELVGLHVALPWETARLVADVLGIWGLVWMLGLAGSYRVFPHLLDEDRLRVRLGHNHAFSIPLDQVASVRVKERGLERSRAVQLADGVLSVVLVSRTNVDVVLTGPITLSVKGQPCEVGEVRFYADDAKALVSTLRAAIPAR